MLRASRRHNSGVNVAVVKTLLDGGEKGRCNRKRRAEWLGRVRLGAKNGLEEAFLIDLEKEKEKDAVFVRISSCISSEDVV